MNFEKKNMVSFYLASIFSKILIFVFNIVVARFYLVSEYGAYNYALTVVSYFSMLATLGIQQYARQKISEEQESRIESIQKIFSDVLTSEIILAIISSILLISFTFLDQHNFAIILLTGTTIIINSICIDWLFVAKQKITYVTASILMRDVLKVTLLIIAVIFKNDNILLLPVMISFATLSSNLVLIVKSRSIFGLRIKLKKVNLFKYIKEGLPFSASGIFACINNNIDVLIIGIVLNNTYVGEYSAAYKIINLLIGLVAMIFTPIYPVLVKSIKVNDNKMNDILNMIMRIFILFITPVTICGSILSEDIIQLLYGHKYANAHFVFTILLIYIYFFYLREIFGYILSTSGNQKKYMHIVMITSIFNIFLNCILIPVLGIEGAAITTLISEVINFILMRKEAHKLIQFHLSLKKIRSFLLLILSMSFLCWRMKVAKIQVLVVIVLIAVLYLTSIYIFNIMDIKNSLSLINIKGKRE